MRLLHEAITGTVLLHWLTVAVPLATLVVLGGALRGKKAARLLLLGVVMTLATTAQGSAFAGSSQVRYGAPLPMLRTWTDPATGETGLTILRACFVADLLFWCSAAVLLGALVQVLARRLRPTPGVPMRRRRRRRPARWPRPTGSTA